jgi:hypothetical protein
LLCEHGQASSFAGWQKHDHLPDILLDPLVKMSIKSQSYSIEELLALRDSPLVTKPELPAQMEQWIMQPALEKKALQNSQAQYFSSLVCKNVTDTCLVEM